MRLTLAVITVATATLSAQDAVPPLVPSFDAIVLRRNISGDDSSRIGSQPGGVYRMVNAAIAGIFGNAYPSETGEVVGSPDWFNDERYDMTARIVGNPTVEQERDLWRTFFFERMKLRAHYETKEQPTYTLALARSDGRLGPSLKRIPTDCDARRAAVRRGEQPAPPAPASNGLPACSTRMSGADSMLMQSGGQTMAGFGRSLSGLAGRFVVDHTGLPGFYEYTFEFAAPPRPGEPAANDKTDVFTALREQLGLKLESSRTQLQFVVIDHIERPIVD
jgi:uncharacterized protein (TIGR03435 family)